MAGFLKVSGDVGRMVMGGCEVAKGSPVKCGSAVTGPRSLARSFQAWQAIIDRVQ